MVYLAQASAQRQKNRGYQGMGTRQGELPFNRYRVSMWNDEKVL